MGNEDVLAALYNRKDDDDETLDHGRGRIPRRLLALTACGGPVAPAPDSSQIPSAAGTAPRSTEPVTTASASAATTVPAESKTTDSSGDGYGGGPSSYMSLYLPEFTISGIFSDLVDHDDYVAWSNKANSQWQADDEVNHPPSNACGFYPGIQHF